VKKTSFTMRMEGGGGGSSVVVTEHSYGHQPGVTVNLGGTGECMSRLGWKAKTGKWSVQPLTQTGKQNSVITKTWAEDQVKMVQSQEYRGVRKNEDGIHSLHRWICL